jgi:hypothetical protein
MVKRKRYGILVLSTNQEIIPDRNAIDAHAQALMGNIESLLPILKAFAQGIRSPHSFRDASSFQSMCTNSTVCCSEVVFPAPRTAPDTTTLSPLPLDHRIIISWSMVCSCQSGISPGTPNTLCSTSY